MQPKYRHSVPQCVGSVATTESTWKTREARRRERPLSFSEPQQECSWHSHILMLSVQCLPSTTLFRNKGTRHATANSPVPGSICCDRFSVRSRILWEQPLSHGSLLTMDPASPARAQCQRGNSLLSAAIRAHCSVPRLPGRRIP